MGDTRGRAAFTLVAVIALAGGAEAQTPTPTNLQLVLDTAALVAHEALSDLDLDVVGDRPLAIGADDDHKANWAIEHAILDELLARGIATAVDPEDGTGEAPRLSYRVLDLAVGGRPDLLGTRVERRCRVAVAFRLVSGGELQWTHEVVRESFDALPRRVLASMESKEYPFADVEVEEQTWGKYVEPIIVSTVLGSLVYLFFSNR